MTFGSIEYLNLLPFQLFLKKYLKNSNIYQGLRYKRDVPSIINKRFKKRIIDAAFISSIESNRCKCTNIGIVASREVRSVFVIPYSDDILDSASASSNKLAKVLGLNGEVIIGDRALRYYLDGVEMVDLATEWYKRYRLPFVFARLCYNSHQKEIERIAKEFIYNNVRIPQYILKKEAKKRGISPKELTEYLSFIHYDINYKSDRAFRLFIKRAKRV
ncbi:Menaquinone via 6-amino-6-deoxyfutalosine step 1 [hydrothermal vent metagenome]|uniref:Menaquinone via 6-amino-6-deoxyfutalosine step 1 n=1 Tax=hydrothermal vent metagenome TaxID=652676 RepID=A0A1W1EHZ1_9ZZZZ